MKSADIPDIFGLGVTLEMRITWIVIPSVFNLQKMIIYNERIYVCHVSFTGQVII